MKNIQYNGMGFTTILTIIFVVLKLTNNIDWSWWWVLSPIWLPLLLLGSFLLIFIILISIMK